MYNIWYRIDAPVSRVYFWIVICRTLAQSHKNWQHFAISVSWNLVHVPTVPLKTLAMEKKRYKVTVSLPRCHLILTILFISNTIETCPLTLNRQEHFGWSLPDMVLGSTCCRHSNDWLNSEPIDSEHNLLRHFGAVCRLLIEPVPRNPVLTCPLSGIQVVMTMAVIRLINVKCYDQLYRSYHNCWLTLT